MKSEEVEKTKTVNRVAQKRCVRIFADAENSQQLAAGKRPKLGQETGRRKLHELRRVLGDIKNVNDGEKITKALTIKTGEKTNQKAVPTKRPLQIQHSNTTEPKGNHSHWPPIGLITYDEKEKIREQKLALFFVSKYTDEVYSYLLSLEERFEIERNHLLGQALTGRMRAVLIDYVAGIVNHMDLLQETLQLSTYVIDKFMSVDKETTKTTVQLVALGAVLIATKYEETDSVELNDLLTACDRAWTENDVKRIERTILRSIDYQLGKPLAIHFVRRLSKASDASPMEHCYAKFFADASLLSYQLCSVKPSMIAAASVFLALCLSRDRIDEKFWTTTHEKTSTYKLADFYHVLPHIAQAVVGMGASQLIAIKMRYSSSQLFCVSLMPGCRPETGVINHFCLA